MSVFAPSPRTGLDEVPGPESRVHDNIAFQRYEYKYTIRPEPGLDQCRGAG